MGVAPRIPRALRGPRLRLPDIPDGVGQVNVRELRSLLGAYDPEAVITVWDPLLDAECHVLTPLTPTSPFTLLIESNAQRVTEEDLA
jgi:hypothetical protein